MNLNERPVASNGISLPAKKISTTPASCAGERHSRMEDVLGVAVTLLRPNEHDV